MDSAFVIQQDGGVGRWKPNSYIGTQAAAIVPGMEKNTLVSLWGYHHIITVSSPFRSAVQHKTVAAAHSVSQ